MSTKTQLCSHYSNLSQELSCEAAARAKCRPGKSEHEEKGTVSAVFNWFKDTIVVRCPENLLEKNVI